MYPVFFRFIRFGIGTLTLGLLLILAYLLILNYPDAAFPHRLENEYIRIAADRPLPRQATLALIDSVHRKIRRAACYSPEQQYRVYICYSPRLFAFFSMNRPQVAAVSTPLFRGLTFVRRADIPQNHIVLADGRPDTSGRTLDRVIAHEITHVMTARAVGRRTYAKAPIWLAEGYADYIGMGPASDTLVASAYKRDVSAPLSGRQSYLLYHAQVTAWLKMPGTSIEELFRDPPTTRFPVLTP